jgi:hypothetical protein
MKLTKLVQRWRYVRMDRNISAVKQVPQSHRVSASLTLYQTIAELPLSRFQDCLIDGSLTALVKSGDATTADPVELSALWDDLRIQYADAMKDNEYRLVVSLQKEVAVLECNYNKIRAAICMLRSYYAKQIADALNRSLQTKFKFDTSNPAEYDRELDRAYNRSKGLKIRLDLRTAALQAIMTKYSGKATSATREYFQGVLITLTEYTTADLMAGQFTTYQFCELIRRVNNHYEKVKTQNG